MAFAQTQITSDADAVAPGVQTEITIRTSLQAGERVDLRVRDGEGFELAQMAAPVDASGDVTFHGVTVPADRVTLFASATGRCGIGSDQITVDVTAGADCALALVPAPEANAFSAPLAVLSTRSDPDPLTPGYQTTVQVATHPGWTAQVFRSDGGSEQALATVTAGADGVARVPVTVADGVVGFRATCAGLGNALATPTTTVLVDTTPPGCALLAPAPGSTITPALDANHDLGDGIQLGVVGQGSGPDVEGEPAMVTLTDASGTSQLAASPLDASGATSAMATVTQTVAPAQVLVALTVRDHAGNLCTTTASYDLVSSDDQPPSAITDLTAAAADRQRVRLAFTAPDDSGQPVASYLVKVAGAPITEDSFDAADTAPAGTPREPGALELVDVEGLRIGAPVFFAVAAVDNAGNRGPISAVGPVTTALSQSGAILPVNAAQGALALGAAIAHGRFNDDDLDDLAIAAPTQNAGATAQVGAVYVYFGSPAGIAATPDLTITSSVAGAQLGAGLAALRRPGATRDALAIGAPGSSTIYVMSSLAAGTRAATSAELTIRAGTGGLADSRLGHALVSADIDGDGVADLVASAPQAGGAAIVYGDTLPATGEVVLSDGDAAAANGAIVERFADPGATGRQLGFYLHAVGSAPGGRDDLVLAYADDTATAGNDSLYILRGDGTRPAVSGVSVRAFAPGRDVRLDYPTTSKTAEWGSQVISLDDNGTRVLVISAYRVLGDRGQVLIVAGDVTGTNGIASTSDAGVTLATINAATGVTRFGAALFGHAATERADLDGDGREDLIIAGQDGTVGTGFVWFGGAIPRGTVTTATAATAIRAPSALRFQRQTPQGPAGTARFVGDLDGDGLDDLCWASPFDNRGDGLFEVLR